MKEEFEKNYLFVGGCVRKPRMKTESGFSDGYGYKINGFYWDVIRRKSKDGAITEEKTLESHNVITVPIRTLVAARIKGDGTFKPINFHAVGVGDPAWDASPVDPLETNYPLVDEVFRKSPDIIEYIDPGTGNVVGTPTRMIRIRTTFTFSDMDPSGVYIREQALYGGTATITKDSGHMLDNIRHKKIWKDENVELVRYIRLEF